MALTEIWLTPKEATGKTRLHIQLFYKQTYQFKKIEFTNAYRKNQLIRIMCLVTLKAKN